VLSLSQRLGDRVQTATLRLNDSTLSVPKMCASSCALSLPVLAASTMFVSSK
jgi:hypothetical protein